MNKIKFIISYLIGWTIQITIMVGAFYLFSFLFEGCL
jgi:hypothetical protein